MLRVRLLGPFAAEVDGRPVPPVAWTRRDAVHLVKLLALARGHALHREQVLDLLWPDVEPGDAAPRLHKAVHFARKALGQADLLRLRGELVLLSPDGPVDVDAVAFEHEATAAFESGSPADAADVLDRHPGEPLPEDLYADWAAEPRTRLIEVRARLLRQAGRWTDLLEQEPTDEQAHVAVMRERVAAGDRQGALRQFESLDRILRRELGVDPGPAAKALHDEVLSELRTEGPLPAAEVGRLDQRIRFCRSRDGVTLAYASSGSGPPLLKAANWMTHLDHDWNSPVWRHWLVELSRDRELIRYDERGCGLSDSELTDQSFEDWLRDLEAVVDAAGLTRFPLLGVSQGGPVAITYAARHPERVSCLVLYGSYLQGRLMRGGGETARREHALQVELARLGWGRDDPAFRQVFTSQFMPDGSRELWEAFNALQRQTTSPENAARVQELTAYIDVTEAAACVRAPTLVLHCEHDQRIPFEQGRLTAACVPNSRFVALDSRNHILLADEPAWSVFLREVRRFLADHA